MLLYPSSSECLDGPCFAAAANQQSRKESKASLAGVLRFLLRHVMGGSERAKREEITRREQGKCCEGATEIAEYFIPSRSAVLPGSWKWNRTNISSVQKRGKRKLAARPKLDRITFAVTAGATFPPSCSVQQHNWCSIDEGNACESVSASVVTGMT